MTGERTSKEVRRALLESSPGACSRHTHAPSVSPTHVYQHAAIEGSISCGDAITGDTTNATNVGGTRSNDHFYSFTGSDGSSVAFDTCGSSYDTWLRVVNATTFEQVLSCDDCRPLTSCGADRFRTEIHLIFNASLTRPDYQTVVASRRNGHDVGSLQVPPGEYVLHVEGFGTASGAYNVNMTCNTSAPTAAPTAVPTTSFPTSSPTSSSPTSSPTTSSPTATPTRGTTLGSSVSQSSDDDDSSTALAAGLVVGVLVLLAVVGLVAWKVLSGGSEATSRASHDNPVYVSPEPAMAEQSDVAI